LKISAKEFWELLPIALERVNDMYQARYRHSFSMRVQEIINPGAIQAQTDWGWWSPLTIMIWFLTGTQLADTCACYPFHPNVGDRIGLDRRFQHRLHETTQNKPGHSKKIRERLIKILEEFDKNRNSC
jgi:hypothetical protein